MLLSNYEMLLEIHTMEKCDFLKPIIHSQIILILYCIWIHSHGKQLWHFCTFIIIIIITIFLCTFEIEAITYRKEFALRGSNTVPLRVDSILGGHPGSKNQIESHRSCSSL